MPSFTVPTGVEIQLAKDYLKKHVGVSSTLWRKIKVCDTFCINGSREKATIATVHPGDTISYTLDTACLIAPTPMPLTIAYEDEFLLIADKPAGLLMHPTVKEHTQTLANGIMSYYKENNLNLAFHPVHRLDKDTSGLVLIAKLPQIQHQLSSFGKNFRRTYYALASGEVQPTIGTIDLPIKRHPDSIIQRITAPDGQTAITHYTVLSAAPSCSLIEITLETGRTHQIRVHFSAIDHPLLGDDLYGGSPEPISRQALHAGKIQLIHPVTMQQITIISPLPSDMAELIAKNSLLTKNNRIF